MNQKARPELLELAEKCGARLTGEPDGSTPIEIIFSISAWRAFDAALVDADTAKRKEAYQNGFTNGYNRGRDKEAYINDPLGTAPPAPDVSTGQDAAIAAIQFAIDGDDGLTWLRLWNYGDFDACRAEWPEAPEAAYIGADPRTGAHLPHGSTPGKDQDEPQKH